MSASAMGPETPARSASPAAAIAMQRANDTPRVGVHVGEAATGGFGESLAVASALCERARPGEILVSELVRMLLGTRAGAPFEPAELVDAGAATGPVVGGAARRSGQG